MNRIERKRNSADVTGPREQRQIEQQACRHAKSQVPEAIKRFDRKFGKRKREPGYRKREGASAMLR